MNFNSLIKLQQTKNNIIQLQIYLISLQAVAENDEIANKIIDIENDIENLKQEERNLETKITESTEVTNIFQNRIEIPTCSKMIKSSTGKSY